MAIHPDAPSMLIESEIDADALLSSALELCAKQLGVDEPELLEQLRNDSPKAHSVLRYALAKEVAEYLRGLRCGIRGVFLYGSTMTDTAGLASDIDLIVLVEMKLYQAQTLLQHLDLALVTSYRALVGREHLFSFLDVHLVDVKEERENHGYAALLHSPHTRPVSLWQYTST